MSVLVDELLPTAEDVAFYEEHGWILTPLRIRDEALSACRAAVDEVYAGKYDRVFDWSLDKANVGFSKRYEDRSQPRIDAYVSHHKLAVQRVLWDPTIARYASALIGARRLRLYRDVLVTMPASGAHFTGLHVDKNYWPTCSSDLLTTAWFALSDCSESDGCLAVVDESHRWRRTTFVRKLEPSDLQRVAALYDRRPDEVRLVAIPHQRGQISFHSCLLLHGSMPNTGEHIRQSFALVYQDGDNRYVPAEDPRMASFNTNDRLGPRSDGVPDYADEQFYPTLYPRTQGG